MNPELLRQGLFLTFFLAAAAPVAHAWGCWNSGDFPRYPPLAVSLALAAILNAVLISAYRGSPDAIGFAIPAAVYLFYLMFPATKFSEPERRYATGDRFDGEIPGLRFPAVMSVNNGSREPFSRMELVALESVRHELSLAGISTVAVCADSELTMGHFQGRYRLELTVLTAPAFLEQAGYFQPLPGEYVRPAFLYIDADRTVQFAHYSGHLCERVGPEAILTRLERDLGVVFPDVNDETGETASSSGG